MTPTPPGSSAATARLSVNLGALKANYQILCSLAGSSHCAGVVKADAYGLGLEPVAHALWQVGCRTYFVAILSEAEILRRILPRATIYVLGGLFEGAAADYAHIDVRPILASAEEIDEWSHYCRSINQRLPAAVHVDTGINRLGLEYSDAVKFFQAAHGVEDFELCMVMSHLACADEPEHHLNIEQVQKFEALREYAPDVPFSMANSAGVLALPDAHFDLVRPGIALYGSNPVAGSDIVIAPVITLEAAILQVRTVACGQSVGYGATFTCQRTSKIAILGLGYADGYFRSLGGADAQINAYVQICGHRAPVVGRVSMDMIAVDVTDLPEDCVGRGVMAEVVGENILLDWLAHAGKTFSYEFLTRLGNRFDRVYK